MTMKRFRKTIVTLIAILCLAGGWQIIAVLTDRPEFIPSIPQLVRTLLELSATEKFYQSIGMTTFRGIIGMVLSTSLAIGAASLFVRFRLLYELSAPALTLMRSVPVISFILLALIFLNPESIPLLIAFLTMFPLLTENLTKGLYSLCPESLILARQFRLKRINTLSQIIYPQLKPFLYSGLASAAGFGWRAIIMGEALSQCASGIGSDMKLAQSFIDVPALMVWTFIAILISFLFDKGIRLLSHVKPGIYFPRTEKAPVFPPLPSLHLHDISYRYGISHFSYDFRKGFIYGVNGPSGQGKTTLLRLIGGVLRPIQGNIVPLPNWGIATIFQEAELLPELNVQENVTLPLSSFYSKAYAQRIAQRYLCDVEMENLSDKLPEELSYGQRQRVAIARALAYPSPLLLMDEPFNGLDNELKVQIIERIRKQQAAREQIIIFTSHDTEELKRLADKEIELKLSEV